MKRAIFIGTLACAVGLYACKKDGTTTTITNSVYDTTTLNYWASGIIDADTLTANLTVGYGTAVADSVFPATSADAGAPRLDSNYSRNYTVARGGYLTIYPSNLSGTVAGYYVQVVGAHSYFNISYSAADVKRSAARVARQAEIAAGARSGADNNTARGFGDGYIDSTIVIKIPASLNGDTFYVKYAAYDDQNRVSNVTTALVQVIPANTGATVDSLQGTWRYLGQRYYSLGAYATDTFSVDTVYYYGITYYGCVEGALTNTGNPNDTPLHYSWYTYFTDYIIDGNTAMRTYTQNFFFLDVNASTCTNYVFKANDPYSYSNKGGYTFDAATRKITFILSNSSSAQSNVDLTYNTYTIVSLTATEAILSYGNSGDAPGIYFAKFIKQ